MTGRPTLRDVAQEAGVSVCTVSKALRSRDGVAAGTATRVRDVADRLGYVPNGAARALVSRQSRTIGFLVANASNRYHGELLSAVTRGTQPSGFNIITGDSLDADGVPQPGLEEQFTHSLAQHRVAGIIAMGPVSSGSLRTFEAWRTPIVFVDTAPQQGESRRVSVLPDNRLGAELAGRHLVEHGYRRFAFVGHPRQWTSRVGREAGFLEATRGHGTTAIVEGGYNVREAREAVLAHLDAADEAPDAIFTSNEAMLRGTLEALSERGLRPGVDLGVVSFDEFDWADRLQPAVTTVDQHVEGVGERAAELLLALCEDPSSVEPQTVLVRPTLIVRDSCGPHEPR